jgi:DNA-binding NtrC family response regulator
LIVDDDETVLAEASDLIQRFGYNALVTSNGVDALEILSKKNAAVLFSDISMPGMNGEELAHAAAALRQGLRVILASGGARGLTIAAAFVPKPYRAADLIDDAVRVLKYPGVNPKRPDDPDGAPVQSVSPIAIAPDPA